MSSSGRSGASSRICWTGLISTRVGWWVVVQADDDAHEALAAEGDEDARADCGGDAVDRVGEVAVERNGQGDIAVGGHQD